MSTVLEVAVAAFPIVGTAVLCWLDPAGLAEAKYGPRKFPESEDPTTKA